ncbi:MAG: crotonase/enoyl-CoA hydratase family protein [Halioglobus sp.]
MQELVTVRIENNIASVHFNRPHKRNAITGEMLALLRSTARELSSNTNVYVVVLSGNGGHFSAGMDTEYMMQMQSGELNASSDSISSTVDNVSASGANEAQQAAWAWQELRQPVIASIEGCAMGVGVDIALAADFRVIHPEARLAMMQVKWGLLSDMSATQTVSRLVPLDIAKLLVLTGREVSGTEAVELGLGTMLSETPFEQAMELARELAGNNPDAVQEGKQLLNYVRTAPPKEGLLAESKTMSTLLGTANQIEAVSARFEGRVPKFSS